MQLSKNTVLYSWFFYLLFLTNCFNYLTKITKPFWQLTFQLHHPHWSPPSKSFHHQIPSSSTTVWWLPSMLQCPMAVWACTPYPTPMDSEFRARVALTPHHCHPHHHLRMNTRPLDVRIALGLCQSCRMRRICLAGCPRIILKKVCCWNVHFKRKKRNKIVKILREREFSVFWFF